jgi:hypothetical protein
VNEKWGWDQLTVAEYNEFLEAEAFAAHIGQFIHKGGKLDQLRAELPTIKTLEFMEIETGKKTPMTISVHHKADDLMELHEELAGLHRGYEQKVNYFKAKVKNAVTAENARIAKENAIAESSDLIITAAYCSWKFFLLTNSSNSSPPFTNLYV